MLQFLNGGGRMAEAILAHDWSGTSIGPPDGWDDVLKTTVAMMLGSHFPKCLVWGPDMVTLFNDAYVPILGEKPNPLGQPFNAIWAEAWDEIGPIAARAYAGEATFIEDYPLTVERGAGPEQAWFTFCYSPLRDSRGRVVGMLDTVIESTGKVRAERLGRVVAQELAHRVKNTFAVLQAVAGQTFRGDAATPDARKRFDARVAAMGRAQNILLQSDWDKADIHQVIADALSPFQEERSRFRSSGPTVTITGRQTLSLSLALHELATNAGKYGALSVPEGTVTITWQAGQVGSDELFVMTWTEEGGPPPTRRGSAGFGSRLIERVLPADFKGESRIELLPEGLCCTLLTRMANLIEPEDVRFASLLG